MVEKEPIRLDIERLKRSFVLFTEEVLGIAIPPFMRSRLWRIEQEQRANKHNGENKA